MGLTRKVADHAHARARVAGLIERNARLRRIQEGERHETWERWSRGEGAGGLGLRDAFANNKIMVSERGVVRLDRKLFTG